MFWKSASMDEELKETPPRPKKKSSLRNTVDLPGEEREESFEPDKAIDVQPNSTVQTTKMTELLTKNFPDFATELPIENLSCLLQGTGGSRISSAFYSGNLLATRNYIFYLNGNTKEVIPLTEVTKMTKVQNKTIEISTKDRLFVFTGFSLRDKAFDLLEFLQQQIILPEDKRVTPVEWDVVMTSFKSYKENKQIHDIWPQIPEQERVISHFGVSLDVALQQGRLYITNYYNMYFHSHMPMSVEIKEIIPMHAVTSITKNTSGLIGSSTQIHTAGRIFDFKPFSIFSESFFEYLLNIWSEYKNRPAVFGVPLATLLARENRKSVPIFVEQIVNQIRAKCLDVHGLFRVSASKREMERVTYLLERGETIDVTKFTDNHLPGALLKKFFRELPDPLFTNEFYECFISLQNTKDVIGEKDILEKYGRLMKMLPEHHNELARFMIDFLAEVSQHKDRNEMNAKNLAIIWAPLLFRTPEETQYSIKEAGSSVGLMFTFITKKDQIFL